MSIQFFNPFNLQKLPSKRLAAVLFLLLSFQFIGATFTENLNCKEPSFFSDLSKVTTVSNVLTSAHATETSSSEKNDLCPCLCHFQFTEQLGFFNVVQIELITFDTLLPFKSHLLAVFQAMIDRPPRPLLATSYS